MALVVDTHTHVISPDIARHPLAPLGGHQSDWSRARPVSHEQLLAAIDAAGIDKALVVQASTAYGHDNSCVVEAVAAHPTRFAGVFSVDVLAADAAARIRHWYDAGLIGLRLFTTGTTMPGQATWLDSPESFPAWDLAQQLRLPVCVQMTMDGIPLLRRLLDRFPGVTVILDHLARVTLDDGPPYRAAAPLFDLARYPRVFLKPTIRTFEAAASGAATPESFFPLLLSHFGAERIAWGSNFPAAAGSPRQLLERARASLAMLAERDREWIFGRTACLLYPALGDADG
ncbi:MAG: amidohydrolase [Rhodospirillales bacterium]|nr:amidohydrolase [Rhodospirillales bacterium]